MNRKDFLTKALGFGAALIGVKLLPKQEKRLTIRNASPLIKGDMWRRVVREEDGFITSYYERVPKCRVFVHKRTFDK